MTITCAGYDGTVDESQWAQMAQAMGGVPTVLGATDLEVTAVPSSAWTVSVAPGTCWAHGVSLTSDSPAILSCDAPIGTRYDYVVATRDWFSNSGRIEIVKGGSALAPEAVLKNRPGAKHHQLLAALKLSAGAPTTTPEVLDKRCWTSKVALAHDVGAVVNPSKGDRVSLIAGGERVWDGSQWRTVTPRLATGTKTMRFGGSMVYSYDVTFATPFTKTPAVLASMASTAGGSAAVVAKTSDVTAAGFTLTFITVDNSKPKNVTCTAVWAAIGE